MQTLIKLIKRTYRTAQPRERQTVMDNVAYLSLLQVITYLLPIIIVPYLFQTLGPEKFGLIFFAQAFIQYFIIFTDYAFNISATKEISLNRTEPAKISRIFSEIMLVKIALSFLSMAVLGVIAYSVPKFRDDWLVYVLTFGIIFGNVFFPVWFFQGIEKMRYITNLNIAGGFIYAFAVFFLVKKPQDFLMVPAINSCVSLLTGLLAQYIVFRKFRISFKFCTVENMLQQLKAGWNIFISIAAINAYTNTRIFLLGLLTNNNITGFYSMAEKIANACQTFPLNSFTQALFPRLSRIFKKNKLKALKIMRRVQQITLIISLICLPVIFIFSGLIVKIACGKNYPEMVLSLRLLLISVFFVAANAFKIQFLLVCGKTRLYSRIHVIMALLGLPLILILTSHFSYAGAAVSAIIIEALIFTATYVAVRKIRFS